MTEALYLADAYRREATATVIGHTDEGGVRLDRSLFYPAGGGQPGDSGRIDWQGGSLTVATALRDRASATADIVLVPSEPRTLPPVGAQITQVIDWDRRYAHMRVHTALHLLSVVLPFGVTGGSISAGRGRLDFDMDELPADREALTEALNAHVAADLPVTEDHITEAALDANPALVKTLSVQPPRGAGRIRLIRIGNPDAPIDLQPCGGTHVARTGEIGALRIGKVEKKGRMNRRVYLHLD